MDIISLTKGLYQPSAKRSSVDVSERQQKLYDYFGRELVNSTTFVPNLKLNASIVYQDWMFKRKGVLSNWKERWFCICNDTTLRMIYNDGQDKLIIDLTMMTNLAIFCWNSSAGTGTIHLECIERTWKFMLPDKERFQLWKRYLNQSIKSPSDWYSNTVINGWLQKRGQVNKAWKKRWCRLYLNGMFCYYKSKASSRIQGHFVLQKAISLKIDNEKLGDFRVHLPGRVWYFRASSVPQCRQWCNAISPFVTSTDDLMTDALSEPIPWEKDNPVTSICNSFEKKSYVKFHQRINSSDLLNSTTIKPDYFKSSPSHQKENKLSPLENSLQRGHRHSYSNHFSSSHEKMNSNPKNSLPLSGAVQPYAVDNENKKELEELSIKNIGSLGYKPREFLESKTPFFREGANELSLISSLHLSMLSDWKANDLSVSIEVITNKTESINKLQDKRDNGTLSSCDHVQHSNFLSPSASHKTDVSFISLHSTKDWTYEEVLSSAFYRFAGVSPYSNTNLKMSKPDLQILLRCLQLEKLCDVLYSSMETNHLGLVPIGDFISVMLEEDISTRITNTNEYRFLVVTLMTMKNIDPSQSKRVSREDFHTLMSNFLDDEDEIDEIFQKYDTDGVGRLHVANLFFFLCDYCDLDDEDNKEDEKYDDEEDDNYDESQSYQY